MKRAANSHFLASLTAVALWLSVITNAQAGEAGKAIFVYGTVTVERPQSVELKKGDVIAEGDVVVTGERSRAQLIMKDGAKVALKPGTQLVIDEYFEKGDEVPAPGGAVVVADKGSSVTTLIKGGFRTITGAIAEAEPEAYQAKTPVATLGIRGTDFVVVYCNAVTSPCTTPSGEKGPDDGLYVGVSSGSVELNNSAGGLVLDSGQYGAVESEDTPPKKLPGPPPVIYVNAAAGGEEAEESEGEEKAAGEEAAEETASEEAASEEAASEEASGEETAVAAEAAGDEAPASTEQAQEETALASESTSDESTTSTDPAAGTAATGTTTQTPTTATSDTSTASTGTTTPATSDTSTAGTGTTTPATSDTSTASTGTTTTASPGTATSDPAAGTATSDTSTASTGGTTTGSTTDTQATEEATSSSEEQAQEDLVVTATLSVPPPTSMPTTTLTVRSVSLSPEVAEPDAEVAISEPPPIEVVAVDETGNPVDLDTGTPVDPVSGSPISTDFRNVTFATGPLLQSVRFSAATSNLLNGFVLGPSGAALVAFNGPSPGAPATRGTRYTIGTARNFNVGFDPISGMRWGRWSTGSANVTQPNASPSALALANQSLHWVLGPLSLAPPVIPQTGSATYDLIAGNSDPSDNLGNVGVLGSAELLADFTNQTVMADVLVSIAGSIWSGNGSGALTGNLFGGVFSTVLINNSPGAGGSFSGFFAGPSQGPGGTPNGAGMSYALENLDGNVVSGVVVFGPVRP